MAGNRIADLNIHISDNATTAAKHIDKLVSSLTSLGTTLASNSIEPAIDRIVNAMGRLGYATGEATNSVREFKQAARNTASATKSTADAAQTALVPINAFGVAVYKGAEAVEESNGALKKASGVIDGTWRAIEDTTKSVQKIEPAAKKATTAVGNLAQQFIRLMKIRIMRLAINKILQGLTEGFKNAYLWSMKMGDSFAGTVDTVYSALSQLKNQLGSFVSELFTALAPVLLHILTIITTVIDKLSMLFAYANGKSSYKKAVNNNVTYASSLSGIGSSADSARGKVEELQRTILGFDEMNILNDESKGGSGSGSGGGGGVGGGTSPEIEDLFTDAPITLNSAETILGEALNIGAATIQAGELIAEGVTIPIEEAWNPQKGRVPEYLGKVGDYVSNLTGVPKAANDVLSDVATWLNYTLPAGINKGTAGFSDKFKNSLIEVPKQQAEALAILNKAWGNEDLSKRYADMAAGMENLQKANSAHAKVAQTVANANAVASKIEAKGFNEKLKSGQYWYDRAEDIAKIESEMTDEQYKLWKQTGDYHLAMTGLTYEAEYWQEVTKKNISSNDKLGKTFEKMNPEVEFWQKNVKNGGAELKKGMSWLTGYSPKLQATLSTTKSRFGHLFTITNLTADSTKSFAEDTKTLGEAIAPTNAVVRSYYSRLKTTGSWLDYDKTATDDASTATTNFGTSVDSTKSGVRKYNSWLDTLKTSLGIVKTSEEETTTATSTLGTNMDNAKTSVRKTSNWFDTLKTKIGDVNGSKLDTWEKNTTSAFNKVKTPIDEVGNKIQRIKDFGKIDVKLNLTGLTSTYNGGGLAKWLLQNIPMEYYASGGFPTEGQMFVARENGAEMVGTINGRTAVANNSDIVRAISQGVYEAMRSSMGGQQTTEVNVYMDSVKVAKAVQKGNQVLNRSFNLNLA